jgi:hypothetical protein
MMKKNLLICLFVLFGILSNAQVKNIDLVINDINIIDVAHNKTLPHQTIYINKGKIILIEKSSAKKSVSNVHKIINGTGKYIMPSLWDMHVHFGGDTLIEENKMLLPLYIAMGISHVRDCAGDISPSVIEWKNQIQQNKLLGPTIFTSGPKLEGIKSIWPGDLEIGNEAEMNKALDSLQKLQVDFIKITDNTLAPELFLKSIQSC